MSTKNITKYKKVSVLGLGYVGLPTAAIIANKGLRVIGVDTNASTVKTINEGKSINKKTPTGQAPLLIKYKEIKKLNNEKIKAKRKRLFKLNEQFG